MGRAAGGRHRAQPRRAAGARRRLRFNPRFADAGADRGSASARRPRKRSTAPFANPSRDAGCLGQPAPPHSNARPAAFKSSARASRPAQKTGPTVDRGVQRRQDLPGGRPIHLFGSNPGAYAGAEIDLSTAVPTIPCDMSLAVRKVTSSSGVANAECTVLAGM